MFGKYFGGTIAARVNPSPLVFSTDKKNSHLFSSNMKKFSYCRFHPMEMSVFDNRDCRGRTQWSLKVQVLDIASTRGFIFNGNSHGRNKEYQGKKLVGYSANKMFDVVADVEKYSKFLPFCKKSQVTFRSTTHIKADLVIGFPPLIESYTSNVTLVKPKLIKAVCTDGKLFNYLLTTWKFSPGLKNNENTCIIDFFVSFEFRLALHSHLAHFFFNELVSQMEYAFYQEAKNRYGKPVVKMQTLNVLQKNS